MELCLYCEIPRYIWFSCFFFNDTATTEIYTLSLHDALPIWIYLWYNNHSCIHFTEVLIYMILYLSFHVHLYFSGAEKIGSSKHHSRSIQTHTGDDNFHLPEGKVWLHTIIYRSAIATALLITNECFGCRQLFDNF